MAVLARAASSVGAERAGQQVAERSRRGVGIQQQRGAARLQQQLPAAAARHQRRTVAGYDADRHQRPGARGALGADEPALGAQA